MSLLELTICNSFSFSFSSLFYFISVFFVLNDLLSHFGRALLIRCFVRFDSFYYFLYAVFPACLHCTALMWLECVFNLLCQNETDKQTDRVRANEGKKSDIKMKQANYLNRDVILTYFIEAVVIVVVIFISLLVFHSIILNSIILEFHGLHYLFIRNAYVCF